MYSLKDYNIKIFYSEEEGGYIARLEEINLLSAFGETSEKALKELETAFEGWMEAALEKKFPVPEPAKNKKYNGKVLVRMPNSLHETLSQKAELDGISLNQEILACISLGLGFLAGRKQNAMHSE